MASKQKRGEKEKYGEKELSAKTLDIYMRFLTNRILPEFGHMRIDQINPFHIVNFISKLGKEGSRQDGKAGCLSSGTIHYLHRILNNIFSRATEWRILKINPAAEVKKPKVTHKEIIVYDESELNTLFQTLQNKETLRWQLIIMLAITTGLRRGELVGLEWKHIDWNNNSIEVRQSISMSKSGERIIKMPKTKKSKRKVSLPDGYLMVLLKQHFNDSLEKKQALGDARQGGEHFFVFSNELGNAYYPETPYLHFRSFLKRNKLRYIRFHDLRHLSATLLINKGVHAKVISERLGHASISTTMNVYGHALQSADRDAANQFNSIIPTSKK
ncbi:site-specific integrase [Paenibacillus odorifer]|uniref:tyrosine-type recombinase/integrase n=1 Tax=Paenibacillus odorifer TaxID=189426 RepID=UPI00096D36F4|nr:site-specific integrase [Paenibacillus odorifer]OMD62986.1 site-specific integrase [Paenibacillus odorifer]